MVYAMFIEKNFRGLSYRIWTWNVVSIITSNSRLAIYNWNISSLCWYYVACVLERKGDTYDYCCKKGS